MIYNILWCKEHWAWPVKEMRYINVIHYYYLLIVIRRGGCVQTYWGSLLFVKSKLIELSLISGCLKLLRNLVPFFHHFLCYQKDLSFIFFFTLDSARLCFAVTNIPAEKDAVQPDKVQYGFLNTFHFPCLDSSFYFLKKFTLSSNKFEDSTRIFLTAHHCPLVHKKQKSWQTRF